MFLIGPVFLSALGSFAAWRLFDFVFPAATGTLANTARAGVSVGAWTAITTVSGMRGITKFSRKLRQRNAAARSRLEALAKGE